MCEPTTIAISLAVAQGVSQVVGASQAASAQKKANARSRELIIQNQNLQIKSLQNREDEEAKRATQEMIDNQKAENAAIAKARVSAGEAGVSGLSIDALLQDLEFTGTENDLTIQENLDFNQRQRQLEAEGIGITSQSQINQLPAVQQPDYLGIALNTGANAFGAYSAGDISSGSTFNPATSAPPRKPIQ